MGASLAEYAAQHPQTQPAQERAAMAATADTIKERQQEQERAEQLKASVLAQLEQGNAPHSILYTAITAIGLLTHDEEWAAAAQSTLDNVYSDLAQQSLLTDNATIAAQRLEAMRADYNAKLRRQIKRQLAGYQRLAKGLNEALNALNELDPEEPAVTE